MAIENPPKAPESLVAMGRLHGLSDGVFAFALTLLVLDIRLPEDILAGNLAAWLLALGPRFFIYLISFIVIGEAWAAHQRMLGQIKAGDGLLVWFNLLSLIFVTLLPASATLLGRFPNTFVAIAAFAGDVALIQLGALWLWRHAASSGLIDASLDLRVVAGIGRRLGFCAFVFTASIGLALFNITAVFVVWIGVFVLIFTTDWLSWQQAINTRRETFPIQRDSRASVHIVHAAGSLQVKAAEGSSDLLAGLFGGGVTASLERSPETTEIDLRVSKLQGFMSLRFPWVWGQGVMLDWSLALTDQIPLALKIETAGSQADLDLRKLRINELILQIGAGTALVNLPSHAGRTIVRIKASAAALTLHVPPQVAARIVTKRMPSPALMSISPVSRAAESPPINPRTTQRQRTG